MRSLLPLVLASVVTSDPCQGPVFDSGEAWTAVQRSGYVKITTGEVTSATSVMSSSVSKLSSS